MKKLKTLIFILAIHQATLSLALNDLISYFWSTQKPLTFLVFMAADNNLHSFINDDLQEMKKIGSNNNINILAYLNTKFPGQPKVSRKLVIHQGYITQHGRDKVNDSGDPQTVITACKWAMKHYPAQNFVLVFWNHGSGSLNRACPRSVCYDDTTGNYLTDAKLQEALEQIIQIHGKKLDIIAFDACLMADIEVAYAIKNYAHYMVASQETIPGTGYGYDYALADVAKHPMHPYQLVKLMVHAYDKEYKDIANDYTLSGVHLSKVDILTQNTNRIAQTLSTLLQNDLTTKCYKAIRSCVRHCTSFDKKYIDMFHFYVNLQQRLQDICPSNTEQKYLDELLEEGLSIITKSVIDNVFGPDYPNCHGLSIYFDPKRIDESYRTTVWANESQWLKFLETYHEIRSQRKHLG